MLNVDRKACWVFHSNGRKIPIKTDKILKFQRFRVFRLKQFFSQVLFYFFIIFCCKHITQFFIKMKKVGAGSIIFSFQSILSLYYSYNILNEWMPHFKKLVLIVIPQFLKIYYVDWICFLVRCCENECLRYIFWHIKQIINLFVFFYKHLEAAEFRRRAQAVQRDLPRPSDVNTTVLRPPEMKADLNIYQEVIIFN